MRKIRNILFVLPLLCIIFASFSCAANIPSESKSTTIYTKQYLFIGDSITNGHGNTSLEAYPHQVSMLLRANSYKFPEGFVVPSGWLIQNASGTLVVNHGLESQKIQMMLENIQTQVGERLNDANETIVVLLGGINDIGQGRTAAAIQADWAAYGAWCDANNVKLYIATMPAVTNPAFNAVRIEANAWLRANWQNFADKLIDLAGNEALANAADLTYFKSDGVHPTATGDLKMAQIAFAVINNSYQSPTITRTNIPTGFFRRFYNQTLTVSGGDGLIVWKYMRGELPAGITFNARSQRFEGTPTLMGTYPNIVIRAVDATGDFHERMFSIVVTRKYTLCVQGFIPNCSEN